jgi:hypothetical protein
MYTFNIDPNKHLEEFSRYNDIFVTLRGVFLALILFCASFLAPYIGCNYQNILKTNYYTRYLILFLVIYFSINLTDDNSGLPEHPMYAIMKSLIVFCLFLLLNNINISVIVILLVLFALLIIISKYYNYYKQANLNVNNEKVKLDVLYVAEITLSVSIVLLLVSSFFLSYKKKEYRSMNLTQCKL